MKQYGQKAIQKQSNNHRALIFKRFYVKVVEIWSVDEYPEQTKMQWVQL